MLSCNAVFTRDDIHDVVMYKAGKVFKLVGASPQDSIIVKQEIQVNVKNTPYFEQTKLAMSKVDSTVGQAKKLAGSELDALREFLGDQQMVTLFEVTPALGGAHLGLRQALDELDKYHMGHLWFKMPVLQMSQLDNAMDARMGMKAYGEEGEVTRSKDPIREFVAVLKAQNGLEQLGRIIAVDMFNGNNDRVNPDAGVTRTYGKREFKFKTIQNIGNLFLAGSPQARSISGMDFADPNGFDKQLQEIDLAGTQWYGPYLIDKNLRRQFAKNVIADLELIFTPNRKNIFGSKLGSNAATRLEAGFLSGIRAMIYHFSRGQFPPAIVARVNELKKLDLGKGAVQLR